MAVTITSSPFFLIHHPPTPTPTPIKNTSKRLLMLAKRDTTSSSLIRIGSSINIQKVFEDKSTGILCYLDDEGEMTCEGYDEGPRLHHHPLSRFSSYQRGEQDILHLLKRSLLEAIDGADKSN